MSYTDLGLAYGDKQRAAMGQRDASLAMTAFSRLLSQQRGARDITAFDKSQDRGVQTLGAGYGNRGLANSGMFRNAASDYSQDWMTQRNDKLDALRQQMAQYDLTDAQSNSGYANTEADINLQKQRDILSTASTLHGLQPFFGA
jgi:hypothetical protein